MATGKAGVRRNFETLKEELRTILGSTTASDLLLAARAAVRDGDWPFASALLRVAISKANAGDCASAAVAVLLADVIARTRRAA